ncbi:MAG: leucine-rich repeat domain-containing protein [Oscillospiraceae bacterium]|nr:leucine-rich repeat domain-containing protein [Oscillospiraceae bacterium]
MKFNIDKYGVLTKYTGIATEIIIPNGVTGIGDHAFQDCKNLTNIIIPDSVTNISKYAFNGCKNLKKIIRNSNT